MPTRELRVLVPAPLPEVFAFLSSVSNVPLFTPGVDDAVLLGGVHGLQGASLGLRTRSGRELRAQVTHFKENDSWTVVDERSTVLQMQVESARGGTAASGASEDPDVRDRTSWTLVTSIIAGNWRADQEGPVVAEWERLVAELPARFAAPLIAR